MSPASQRADVRRKALGVGGGAVVLGVVLGLAVLALYPTLDPANVSRGFVLVGGLLTASLVGAGGHAVRGAHRVEPHRTVQALVAYAVISALVGVVLVALAAGGWTPVLVVTVLGTAALVGLAVTVHGWT